MRREVLGFLKRHTPTLLLDAMGPALRGKARHLLGLGPQVRVLPDVAALDEKLRELEAAQSDDALRAGFGTFLMNPPRGLPRDPESDEYRRAQFALYETLAGKPYEVANEFTSLDVATAASSPFPFATKSCSTVGDHLISIGFLFRAMELPPNARVVELGPGWGNTTEFLARMGHRVTAVDINPRFVDLLGERARRAGVAIDAVVGGFEFLEKVTEPYDAVLFFASFHHASDHLRVIRALEGAIKPGGAAIFACEPITRWFPLPWGVRLDGESLWAIRRHGWLELGFREDYFRRVLARHGWRVSKHVSRDSLATTVFVARRPRAS